MIRYTRGTQVVIEAIFHDSTGGIAYPTSVHLTVAYPYQSTEAQWPLSGNELATTSGISMTTPTTDETSDRVGIWTSTWRSAVSGKGIVYWTAVPSTDSLGYGIKEGQFELRGGLASSAAVVSTL